MPDYEEYCPNGLTPKTRRFGITGDRIPSPSTPCLCGGTEQEKALADVAARATMFNAIIAIENSINTSGKPVKYSIYKALIHSSAIRKIG